MFVLVSYDISNDKRRTKVHNILKSYGQWVQFSLFECDLTETQYAKLRSRLHRYLQNEETDSVRFYFLCECCRGKVERLGGVQPMDTKIFFVG